MHGLVLDPVTGRPAEAGGEILTANGIPSSLAGNAERGWGIRGLRDRVERPSFLDALERAPAHVREMLERSRYEAARRDDARRGGFAAYEARASMQSWEELISAIISDGTQVLNTTTETIMVPDFSLPANYLYPGRTLKYTVIGDLSTVATTPGTITLRLRYGGVAGTALATSGAFAPDVTGASTTQTCMVEWFFVARAAGAAASSFTIGRMFLGDFDDASAATIVGNLNMIMIPATAPAAVNINTLTANALSPTVQFSVATATTQFTAHMAFLEALN